jgi:hypothetical protein
MLGQLSPPLQNTTRKLLILFMLSLSHIALSSYYLLNSQDDIEQVPDEELLKFGTLFSTPDLFYDDIITEEMLPEYGPDRPIYDGRGLSIPRFRLKEGHQAKECGVLFKGRGIHSKFAAPDEDDEMDGYDDVHLSTRDVRFFPQAFLPSCGQVQANRPFTEQQSKVAAINREEKEHLANAMRAVDTTETSNPSRDPSRDPSRGPSRNPTPNNSGNDSRSTGAPAGSSSQQNTPEDAQAALRQTVGDDPLANLVTIPKWQGYSYIAHSASSSASSYDSMRGYITAQLGGFQPPHGTLDKSGKDNYIFASDRNNGGLPFQRMEQRMADCKGSALRIEPTIHVNMRAMAKKTGEEVYQVFGRFMGSYDSESSRRATENSVHIFRPGVSNSC